MSQRSRPRFFLAELDLDRNITDLILYYLMWELYGRILSLYEFEDLSEAIKEGDHRVVESPVVKDPPKVEVARTM